MQILLDILRTRARAAFMFFEETVVVAWMGVSEVDGSGEGFPHLAAEFVGEAYLD